MKKTAILFTMLAALLFSCSKSSPTVPETTSLELSLKDELGNPVSGATVKLYSSETNYLNESNPVQSSKTSDAKGIVLFDNLSSIKYYFSADKDCLTNAFGGNVTSNILTPSAKNSATCILAKSGTLKINNTSSNPYDVYINGALKITNMAGGTSQTFKAAIGTYNVRVLQKAGYVFTPTDKTYPGSISCGSTLTCTFP